MRIVIFGLTVSSSWGNGHATLWRGLLRALGELGHDAVFYERDVPYYADHRDLHVGEGYALRLYSDWADISEEAREAIDSSDVAITTSYCPDAATAYDAIMRGSPGMRVFYDLDTPVTLDALRAGQRVPYISSDGLERFDLVLSYTGGAALLDLQRMLGATRTAPLYGSVDPTVHRPVPPEEQFRCDLSYLGTYAEDRQDGVVRYFVEPARRLSDKRFLIGGSMYPHDFPWSDNVWFVKHVAPPSHPSFYCSSRATLNVTRRAMAESGYCPSGRLFEAAACGVPVITDRWQGIDTFFDPATEMLMVESTDQVIEAMTLDPARLADIGAAARERALRDHTARRRAEELIRIIEQTRSESDVQIAAS